jgi:tetratricopeptide (TPR) repeat protein/tRNA A-37 threonylcarbamoyl transferase component Bud32
VTDALSRLKAALADRYTIERELGSGGMATVYLAEDLKHHRKVAVKVLRPELAAALGPERFHREIEIAANLTHPHILPLHDSGDAEGFLYYVMPHIEGESLRDKLAHEGELPIGEAVRILRDVVDALSEAHEKGVVHRDIKPDNILLTKHHALVTDFGVAKAVSEATGRQKLTTEGVALGTPSYMSPEQATADSHIDHRADIYAVGVVAYELLTGRTPFLGTTPQMILSAHMSDTPEPVTKYRESVPPALEQLVMKCLEKKAADRWQSAEELLPQLEALATPSDGITPAGTRPVTARSMARPALRIGVVVAAAVLVGTVAALLLRDRGPRLDERRVVVVPFDNLTGDSTLDTHGEVAASWITAGLERTEALSVVPWFVVQEEFSTLGGRNQMGDLAKLTGAGLIVSGSYFRQGDSVGFRAELTDARRMELLQSLPPVNALPSTPEQALGQLTERVMGALASILDTEFKDVFGGEPHPALFDAYMEYTAGYDVFVDRRYHAAIEHFRRAHEIDPTYLNPLITAAVAYSNLGRPSDADSVLQLVERSGVRMSRPLRLRLDWVRAILSGDNRQYLRKARELAEYAQTATWRYVEAIGCLENNYPAEAVQVLERIDPDRAGRFREWLPYWAVLTEAHHMIGDHRAELSAARLGRKRHPDEVDAVRYEVRALVALGRVEEVKDALEEVLALPPDATWGHAEPAVEAGQEYRAHGRSAAAQEAFDLAIDRLRRHTPDTSRVTEHQYALGSTLYRAERWREAHELFVELAERSPFDPRFQGYLGVLQARLGNREAALQISAELAALDLPYGRGENTLWRSGIAAVLGDRQQAVELLRSAINEGTYFGIWLHRDPDFESLRDYPPFQELMRPKG